MKSVEVNIKEMEEHFRIFYEVFRNCRKENITMQEMKKWEILSGVVKYITEDERQFVMKMGMLMNEGMKRGDILVEMIGNINNVIENSRVLCKM